MVNPLLYKGIRNANRRDVDDLVRLLEERMPDRLQNRKSPASSEEYEDQANNSHT
ncbi:MAG: hypothetical protein H0U65_00820 [Rubrobacter sp.]|jgi:hypothetical protein|nr:hypothetical protein [Rubrobacter sp.]